MVETAPIIVTALFGDEDFAWLNGLREQHFPPERNIVQAHLTLFHHLPPSLSDELKHRLKTETSGVLPPQAVINKVMSLGKGVAFAVASEELRAIRERLSAAFEGMLTPQDQQGWRGHVTIQNKVKPEKAKCLKDDLERDFRPRPLAIKGLASWYYRGGPWEPLSKHVFSGG